MFSITPFLLPKLTYLHNLLLTPLLALAKPFSVSYAAVSADIHLAASHLPYPFSIWLIRFYNAFCTAILVTCIAGAIFHLTGGVLPRAVLWQNSPFTQRGVLYLLLVVLVEDPLVMSIVNPAVAGLMGLP